MESWLIPIQCNSFIEVGQVPIGGSMKEPIVEPRYVPFRLLTRSVDAVASLQPTFQESIDRGHLEEKDGTSGTTHRSSTQ